MTSRLIIAQNPDEGQLAESEAPLLEAFASSPVGMVIATLDGHVLRANSAAARITGYSEAELVGRTQAESIYPEDIDVGRGLLADFLAGTRPSYQVERRYVRKSGEVFWARLTVSAVRDREGKPEQLLIMLEDIDEQKRMLATLQESEARFRAIFENSAIGISLVGVDRRPIEVNPVISRLSGLSRAELIQKDVREISYPDDVEVGSQEFQDLVTGKINSYQLEKRFRRKEGGFYWARLTVSSVRGPEGEIQFVVSMTEDITAQKKAQDQLRESEARFRAMYDNAAVGMAMMTLDRKVVSVNQTASRMTGYTLEELVGTDPSSISHPDDLEVGREQFRGMVSGEIPGFQMEKRFIRKDGVMFWGRVTYSAVPGRGGKPEYVVGMIEDITDQRSTREKLARQEADYRRNLEQRVEERTHELAGANVALLAEIEQRKRAEEALSAKAAEEAITAERTRLARDLHDAVTQTLFAASLIAEVLPDLWDLDREEARKSTEELRQLTRGALAEMRTLLLELRPAALTQARLSDLIRQLCEALIGRARLPINLVTEGDRPLPPEVQVAFYRIAQESLNNAAKYARASRVDVGLMLSPAGAYFSICDDGIGFSRSNLKPASLGMRIMRERAEAIGAELSISSEPGKGVCVEVEWIEKPDMKLSVFKS